VVGVASGELFDPIGDRSVGTIDNIWVGLAVDETGTPVGAIVSGMGVCD
jgi:hypothetical protein